MCEYLVGPRLWLIAEPIHERQSDADNREPGTDTSDADDEHALPCRARLRDRQPAAGYVVLINGMPRAGSFDAEQRGALLDVARDVVDDYADAKIPFRVLYG